MYTAGIKRPVHRPYPSLTWWNVCRKLFMEFCCSYRTTPPSTLFHTWVNVGIELHTLKFSKMSKTGQPLHESWTLCVTTLFVGFDRCFLQNSIYMLKCFQFLRFRKTNSYYFLLWLIELCAGESAEFISVFHIFKHIALLSPTILLNICWDWLIGNDFLICLHFCAIVVWPKFQNFTF